MGAKQAARTTAREQVAPVKQNRQAAVWAAGVPTPTGIPANRARRFAVYRSVIRLAKPQAGRAYGRQARALAEQSTTRASINGASMNAAALEAPRYAACHPQAGERQELGGPVEVRAAAEPREARVARLVWVEAGLAEPAAAPVERFLAFRPCALFLCTPVLARSSRTQTTPAAVPSAYRPLMLELRKMLETRTARSVWAHRPLAPYPQRPVPLGPNWSLRPVAAPAACRWTVERQWTVLPPMPDSHAICRQASTTTRALSIPTVWGCLLVILAPATVPQSAVRLL